MYYMCMMEMNEMSAKLITFAPPKLISFWILYSPP